VAGIFMLAVVTTPFLFFGYGTSLWLIRGVMFVRGICLAFSFVPIQASSYANVALEDTGRASAIYSAQRQVAASLGVAVLATALIERTNFNLARVASPAAAGLGAFHFTFAIAIVLVVIAGASALLIRDRDAANTIRRLAGEVEPTQEPVAAAH